MEKDLEELRRVLEKDDREQKEVQNRLEADKDVVDSLHLHLEAASHAKRATDKAKAKAKELVQYQERVEAETARLQEHASALHTAYEQAVRQAAAAAQHVEVLKGGSQARSWWSKASLLAAFSSKVPLTQMVGFPSLSRRH